MPKAKYTKRKDGRYQTYIQNGFKEDGKPNRISVYANSSAELERKVAELNYKINHNLYVTDSNITLYEYSLKWLETYKASKELNTQKMYKNIINNHLDYLADKKLKTISKLDIQKLINSKSEKIRTCEQIKLVLNQVFECALEDNMVEKNPCKNIQVPKHNKTEKRILTNEEKEAIAKASFTPKEKAFIYIIYFCGLRRGEALALTQSDIDLVNKVLHINKSLLLDENISLIKSTKSYAGIRDVDMPDMLVDYLKEYLKTVDNLLFTTKNNKQITKSSYRRMWDSIYKKIETYIVEKYSYNYVFPNIKLTAHIFRHNYCTMLYYSGMSIKKTVQLMGHADSKMIMQVYAHLDDEKEKTRSKINTIKL